MSCKLSVDYLLEKKQSGIPITMLTAYDYPFARLADDAGIDMVLVGDSLGNVVLGYENTLDVTVDDCCHHTRAVSRAAQRALVLGDIPYLGHQHRSDLAIRSARALFAAGADAVKCEVLLGEEQFIVPLFELDIPIVAHIGFTPQSVEELGGYKVQGRDEKSAKPLRDLAHYMESLGAIAILAEMIPSELGQSLSESLTIPLIGIGAGSACDGQVLVSHDVLGFSGAFSPRFVKQYDQLEQSIKSAFITYKDEVESRRFPSKEHEF